MNSTDTRPSPFRLTARARLAAMFLILFVVFGAGWEILSLTLLNAQLPQSGSFTSSAAITAAGAPSTGPSAVTESAPRGAVQPEPSGSTAPVAGTGTEIHVGATSSLVSSAIAKYRSNALATFARVSFMALLCAALVAAAIAWWGAKRVLRPLRDMAATARRIGAENLDERLPVSGPADELRDLGQTVNDTFDRLAEAFAHERRLIANTSHELRTPVANQRTLLEVTLADPDITPERLRHVCQIVLGQTVRSDALIEAMLTLAGGQQSALETTAVRLDDIVRRVMETTPVDGLTLTNDLCAATVTADPLLTERAVANLILNAVRHNIPDGWIHVAVLSTAQDTRVVVTNSAAVPTSADMRTLREPFRRGDTERIGSHQGAGLGLSIVDIICRRHGWNLDLRLAGPAEFCAEVIVPAG